MGYFFIPWLAEFRHRFVVGKGLEHRSVINSLYPETGKTMITCQLLNSILQKGLLFR